MPGRERGAYNATKRDIEAFFECNGSYRRAYEKLKAERAPVPSRRTWERAIKRALRPDERAFAKYGEDGRRRHQLYLGAGRGAPQRDMGDGPQASSTSGCCRRAG